MTDLAKPRSSCASSVSSYAISACIGVQPVTNPTTSLCHDASGSKQDFVEVEGTTTFAIPRAPTYRYKITSKGGKLRIWLEDCDSKKQWCTGDLADCNFINAHNALPGTGASDYLEYFRAVLDKVVEDASDIPRTFQLTKDDEFRLEISMTLQVLTRMMVVTYSFDLEPISVERIDVLESRMRDLQDEMRALRLKPAQSSNESPKIIRLMATAKADRDRVCWWNFENYSDGNDGIIRNLEPGTYLVMAVVTYSCSSNNLSIGLIKGSTTVTRAYCIKSQSYSTSTLTCTM